MEQAPADALPSGILFVAEAEHLSDSLKHPAAARISEAWAEHAGSICQGKPQSLRDYLRKDFFAYHKALYENRPIYFPLSSEKRGFVAYEGRDKAATRPPRGADTRASRSELA